MKISKNGMKVSAPQKIPSGVGSYVVDTQPQFGTPNCTVRVVLSIYNKTVNENVEIQALYTPFIYESMASNAPNMTGVLLLSVAIDGAPVTILYGAPLFDVSYTCLRFPLDLFGFTAFKFINRLSSFDLMSAVTPTIVQNPSPAQQLFYSGVVNYPILRCKVFDNFSVRENPCFKCQMSVKSVIVSPVMNMSCDYSMYVLNISFTDNLPWNSYYSSSFAGSDLIFRDLPLNTLLSSSVYPSLSPIFTTMWGNPQKPKYTTVLSVAGPGLYSLYSETKPQSDPNLYKYMGYSYEKNTSYYLHQVSPIQTVYISEVANMFSRKVQSIFSSSIAVIVNYLKNPDRTAVFDHYNIDGNIYLKSIQKIAQSPLFRLDYSYIGYKIPMSFQFPFGYTNGTLKNFTHNFDFPFSNHFLAVNIQTIYQNQSTSDFSYSNPVQDLKDRVNPFLTSVEIKPIGAYQYQYLINAGDSESGIYSITIRERYDPRNLGTVTLYEKDLISGTRWNGAFSINKTAIGYNHDTSYNITIIDMVGNSIFYNSDSFVTFTPNYIPPFPSQVRWDESNITSFTASLSIFELSLSNPDPNIKPILEWTYFSQMSVSANPILYGTFNSTKNLYEFKFELPLNATIFGEYLPFILRGNTDITSTYLYLKYNTYLSLSSVSVSMMPPIIGNISYDESNSKLTFGFNCFNQIHCETTPVSGYIVLKGDYNPVPITFIFKSVTNIASVSLLSYLDTSSCRSQNYTIADAVVYDSVNQLTSSTLDQNLLSPFFQFNQSSLTVFFSCQTVLEDREPPILKNFSMSSAIINLNDIITINIVIADNIKLRDYLPTIYLTNLNGNYISYQVGSKICNPSRTECSISYQISIPNDYVGIGNYSVSIYGIVDEYDNFNGYSTNNLLDKFNNSILQRDYSPIQPTVSPTTTPTPSQCTNKCSGNGICIGNNQCQCNNGFYGPNCEGTILIIPKPLPNPEEPTIISEPNSEINLEIQFSELLELDSDKSTIERYPLQNKKWKMESSSDNNTFTYSTKINNETTLYIIIDLTTDERTIEFAGLNITIPPHSIKYTMKLDQYSFKSQLNILQLRMSTAFNSSESLCSSSIDTSSNTKDLEYIKIQYNGKILFGRFIQRSLVDGIPQVATTELIQSTESNGTSFIGINIPNYSSQVILDPNFSVLVTDDYNKCKSSGISTGAIIGIVVGCAAFVIIVIVGATIFGSKTRRSKIFYRLKHLTIKKNNEVELS